MKKILYFLIIILNGVNIFAQAPQSFKYQAVVRNPDGTVLSEQAVGIQITILQGSTSGTLVYQETFSETTNAFGLINLQIGTGENQVNLLSDINWENGPYFIQTAIDASGGTNYVVAGTGQLLSVPYAMHANSVNESNICDMFSFYYADIDGDGYGNQFNTVFSCTQPTGYVLESGDCDDGNQNINPSEDEICDGIDNNCDGEIDEGLTFITYYADTDQDGYGDANNSIESCSQPTGYVTNSDDCNDNNPNINPAAPEICDGIDNNCDGGIDDGLNPVSCENTNEFGTCTGISTCQGELGWVCDASTPAPEVCNGEDDNCNGEIDEGFTDTDGDGEADCVDTDDDNDLILDENDNCPLISNPGQEDFDGDGVGDVCDDDIDNDGTLNDVDCEPYNPAVNTQIGEPCDDGSACTFDDRIDENCNCTGTPVVCDDGDSCTDNICDPVTGNCVFNPVNCDDGDPNTTDYCVDGICHHDPVKKNDK